jgi:hypothetical protein
LVRGFSYLDKFYLKSREKLSLDELSFNLYKKEFFIPLKENLYEALTHYFKEIENLDNDENVAKIKNIFKLMDSFDNISNPKIVKENIEIFWENNTQHHNYSGFINKNDHFCDNWYNSFIKDINSLFEIKEKEINNLPISEYIIELLKFKSKLKKYFEAYYFDKIFDFNQNFINKNIDKISDYFDKMNRMELKQFYELNKKYKACLYLIYYSMKHSIEKSGIKSLENKGIKIDDNNDKTFQIMETKKEIEKLFSDCFDKEDPEYNEYLSRILNVIEKLKDMK